MQFSLISFSPRFIQFALSLLIMLLLYALAGSMFYLISYFLEDGAFYSYLEGIWPVIVIFPMVSSIVHAYSSRKHQLCISELSKPVAVAEWAVKVLQKEGLRIKTMRRNEFILESKKKYNRAMGHWFGTELVQIAYNGNEVIATGHYRYTDVLDSKIRFGKISVK